MKKLFGLIPLVAQLVELFVNKPKPAKSDTVKKAAEEWNARKRTWQ